MNYNNKNLTGLVNINADNIYASSTIENVNASYFTGITSNIQNQINSISTTGVNNLQTQITANLATEQADKTSLQNQITNNYNTEQNDKTNLQNQITALTATEAADAAANAAAIAAVQTEVTTIQTEITGINGSIATIDENIATLQTKTQLQTGSTTSTIFENMIKVNNGVSDQVILNNTDGNNYFINKSVFENDINMQSGTKITTLTTGGQFNLGDSTNVGLMQIQTNPLTGTITLTGNTINLNAQYVNVNGLIFSVNALLNDTGNYFSQF